MLRLLCLLTALRPLCPPLRRQVDMAPKKPLVKETAQAYLMQLEAPAVRLLTPCFVCMSGGLADLRGCAGLWGRAHCTGVNCAW